MEKNMLGHTTRVLVVDDFEPMCKVTVNQLRQGGVEHVATARDGAEALRLLKAHNFDIVLSDWNMPVMGGLELLKAMRADPALSGLPFVLVTVEAERRKVAEAIACGVTSMLLKPYTLQELMIRVERALYWPLRRVADGPLPEGVAADVPPEARQADDRPSLLIVDDTPDNLMLLSTLFRDEYQVRLAQSGAKALQFVTADRPPDLMLLDVMMPGMSGYRVCQAMRAEGIWTPVLFLTAKDGEWDEVEGLDTGGDD